MRFGVMALAMAGCVCVSSTSYAQRIDPAATVPDVGFVAVLSNDDQRTAASAFSAIDRQDWTTVDSIVAFMPDGPLKGFVLAEYYTHANSPRVELPAIEAWLARYAYLPQAEQMVRLGQRRGLVASPDLPRVNSFSRQSAITKRSRPRSSGDNTMPHDVADAITNSIRDDDPDGARALLEGVDSLLSAEARAEWRTKVAWSYYIENRDTASLAMAQRVAQSGTGPWVAEGEFTRGLAAWRLGDCAESERGFASAIKGTTDRELRSAASYWAGRAATRCRDPERATQYWNSASADDETLYGMLARKQLGLPLPARFSHTALNRDDWREVRADPNAQLAVAMTQLGRRDEADEALRHLVRTGDVRNFSTYVRLAQHLGLARTQIWMGHNVPRGAEPDPSLRFPTVNDRPPEGWRVDPSLAFAHALQESDFRHTAVSPANAIGLMQVRPIAARDVDDRTPMDARYADLKEPSVNLSFGQANLAKLGNSSTTQGYLPKVMAAYNAGTTPVARWNQEIRDGGDPLLWMESIPYWETRSYVAIVMRNYWIYQRQQNAPQPSRTALAQNDWPLFPNQR